MGVQNLSRDDIARLSGGAKPTAAADDAQPAGVLTLPELERHLWGAAGVG